MAFDGNFSVVQTSVTSFIITDTSTGSDANLTGRRVYLYLSDGSTLTAPGSSTNYIDWPIADGATITISLLTTDLAINIRVDWISSDPDPAGTYTKTTPTAFSFYNKTFLYGLSQEQQAALPTIITRNGFIANKLQMWGYVLEAINCIEVAGDIGNSQACLNSANNMRNHSNQYF
jgi:hypothetical protein